MSGPRFRLPSRAPSDSRLTRADGAGWKRMSYPGPLSGPSGPFGYRNDGATNPHQTLRRGGRPVGIGRKCRSRSSTRDRISGRRCGMPAVGDCDGGGSRRLRHRRLPLAARRATRGRCSRKPRNAWWRCRFESSRGKPYINDGLNRGNTLVGPASGTWRSRRLIPRQCGPGRDRGAQPP